jgi:hypothetical protein
VSICALCQERDEGCPVQGESGIQKCANQSNGRIRTMRKSAWMWLGLSLALASVAAAQTVNQIPKYITSSTFGDSVITELNGNVGIGTTAPSSYPLDVNGTIRSDSGTVIIGTSTSGDQGLLLPRGANTGGPNAIAAFPGWNPNLLYINTYSSAGPELSFSAGTQITGNAFVTGQLVPSGGIVFADGSTQSSAYTPSTGINIGDNQTKIGYGGIPAFGGLNAGQPIFLSNGGDGGNNQFFYDIYQNYNALYFGVVNFATSSYAGVSPTSFNTLFQINGDGVIITGRPQNTANSSTSNQGIVVSNTLDDGSGDMFVSGKLGIGTTSPGAKLEVSGSVKLTSGSGGSITFQDGTTQSTAYTGVTCGGDYAESVDVTGDRTNYEPGDVLVIDPNTPGKFLKSVASYSTSVSGIYSTKPGTVGRRQTTAKSADEVPMAVVGIVPAKVSAENGPIKVGDLLVTSSTPGYAMKGTDRSRMLGAVVGKAMAKLDSGTGVLEVLVTLQ